MGLMDTLGRIPKILNANLDDLLDKVEDPVKMMTQLIKEAENDLRDTKQSLAVTMADAEVAGDKVTANDKEIAEKKALVEKYMAGARNAAKNGQEADAKELIRRKQSIESEITSLENKKVGLLQAKNDLDENVRILENAYSDLQNQIVDLKNRLDIAKGKTAAAKGQERVSKTLSGRKGEKASAAFSRYEERADKRLKTAQAALKIDNGAKPGGADDLLAKYAGAGSSGSVDDEYAKLMQELQ